MVEIQKYNPKMGIIKVKDWDNMMEEYKTCHAVHINSNTTELITDNENQTRIMVLVWRYGKVVDYIFVSLAQFQRTELNKYTVERLYGEDVVTVNGIQMAMHLFLTGIPRKSCYNKFGRDYTILN